MNRSLVQSCEGVTLIAGGPVGARDLKAALRRAPVLVAADGGADRALALGQVPVAVIGDMDSIGAARDRLPRAALHPINEQETTDFDKTLRSISAPFVLAVGVLGGRMDHALAAMTVLAARAGADAGAMPCLALSREDVVLAVPRQVTLDLQAGDRLSLWPMAPVRGESRGLDWPIDGIDFAPAGRIGTSNRVSAGGRVELCFDAPGMLLIVPRVRLDAVLAAVLPGAIEGRTTPTL